MKKTIFPILIVLIALAGCKPNHKSRLDINLKGLEPQSLTIKQYDKVLFEADSATFAADMKKAQPDFMPFLAGDLDDQQNIDFLWNYVADTLNRRLYNITRAAFPDIKSVESDLHHVYQRFGYHFPELKLPEPYSYISGVNLETPILFGEDAVAIGLDNYLGSNQDIYKRMGFPMYRIMRTDPIYICRDYAMTLHDIMDAGANLNTNLLSEMIHSGKKLYFVEALNPTLPDSVLMGYTASQAKWAKANEGNIWSTIIGENLLYTTDNEIIKKFLGEGPFTAEFSREAPARLGEFIGLQIVRSYMANNDDVSLEQLMRNSDSQTILRDSKYKPRK